MRIEAWVDGGARGNPGPAGWGAHLLLDGAQVLDLWGFLGETTNNVAEYRALIAALDAAVELGAERLVVRTDSQLIERQVTGRYKVRQPHLQKLLAEVRQRIGRLPAFEIHHVPRAENAAADALANRAMDLRASGSERAGAP
ncbi:MAG TPA: ribonuclease HI family protein [Acidobacteria bacterium]|nr:ribonuclease HI family protein [Acidobacteriota bacterium]